MSPHDPLCEDKDGPRYGQFCDCRLIATARADERERIAQAIETWAHDPEEAARIARCGGDVEFIAGHAGPRITGR